MILVRADRAARQGQGRRWRARLNRQWFDWREYRPQRLNLESFRALLVIPDTPAVVALIVVEYFERHCRNFGEP
jgi:hypothetical protein